MPAGVGKNVRLQPKTAADSISDSTPLGSMAQLANLVPAPTAQDMWVPRPGAIVLPNTAAQFTPGYISCMIVLGTYVYGMVSSALNAGKDQPFAYNLVTQTFTTITGITAANVPTSPATSGAWTPPTMDVIGVYVVVTHPGFNGAGNGFFGWINISTVSAPTWASGNTSTNALPAVPIFVKQFFNRAVFVVNPPNLSPATYHTDALNPTSASQPFILTYADNAPIVALGVLGLQNMFGGIIHALMVFKTREHNVWQVTGDFAPDGSIGSVVVNSLEIATTTIAPLGVFPTPRGLGFISPDGIRIIDWQSHISDPIGMAGTGITQAFTQSLVPSRIVASCNGQSIRVTTQNNAVLGQPFQEWVYDLELKKWHGPHSFPASQIIPFGYSYLMQPNPAGSFLTGIWQSDIVPNTQSQYTENGNAMQWTYQTSLSPTQAGIYEQACIYTTIMVAGGGTAPVYTCTADDSNGTSLATASISPPVTPASLWGTMVWGRDRWAAASAGAMQIQIPWPNPIVFDRVSFRITGTSAAGVTLGAVNTEIEQLAYIV